MRIFSTNPTKQQIDTALLILRVVTGVVFLAHGYQKVFSYGFAGVTGAFTGMGIPMAALLGPAVALLELIGGAALIAGLLTRPIAFGLGLTMLGALFMVHLKEGFFAPKGYEFVLTLAAALTSLVVLGAGAYSADAAIGDKNRSPRV